MALAPVKPLYSASATATNGSDTIVVTGSVNCSFIASGAIVSLGTRQLVDAISGTAPDGSGNSTIKLRRLWDDPTTTGKLLVFMSWEGLADAVNRLREIINSSEASLQGAFSYMGDWDASAGDFPPAPGENLGSHKYRVSVAGTMGGRAYKVGETLYYDQYASQWRSELEVATAFSTGLLQSADAAAWRAALGLVKTINPTDKTAGSMLKVGDAGIITPIDISTVGSNANSIDVSARFITGSSWTGSPFAGTNGSNQGYLDSFISGNPLYAVQFFTALNSTKHSAFRRLNNGVWEVWIFNYHQGSILGAVSQSGGIPTGAIIERGSNANGEYVRFADGTIQLSMRLTISGNNAQLQPAVSFNLPSSIVNATTASGGVSAAIQGTTDRRVISFRIGAPGASTLTARFEFNAAILSTETIEYTATVFGRWY